MLNEVRITLQKKREQNWPRLHLEIGAQVGGAQVYVKNIHDFNLKHVHKQRGAPAPSVEPVDHGKIIIPELRLHGVKNLWIRDGFILPTHPSKLQREETVRLCSLNSHTGDSSGLRPGDTMGGNGLLELELELRGWAAQSGRLDASCCSFLSGLQEAAAGSTLAFALADSPAGRQTGRAQATARVGVEATRLGLILSTLEITGIFDCRARPHATALSRLPDFKLELPGAASRDLSDGDASCVIIVSGNPTVGSSHWDA